MWTICELQQQIPCLWGKQHRKFKGSEPGMYRAFVIHYLAVVDNALETHLAISNEHRFLQ